MADSLATGMVFLGLATILSGTGWTDFPDDTFKALGQTKVLGVQMPVFYMIVHRCVCRSVLQHAVFSAVVLYGCQPEIHSIVGYQYCQSQITTFIIGSFMAALGGIISAMRFNSAIPNVGTGVELRAVTAAVIGGISFSGGNGNIAGAAMGALFIAVLNNALTIANVPPDRR